MRFVQQRIRAKTTPDEGGSLTARPTGRGCGVTCALAALALSSLLRAAVTGDFPLTNALVVGSVGRTARDTTHTDAVEARIVSGQWLTPQAQDKLMTPDGAEQTWEPIAANQDGWFEHRALRGGYVSTTVDLAEPRVMILQAAGHNAAYVNGEIRAGDPYGYGYLHLPVCLKAGPNELLFSVSRGRLRARLTPPKANAILNPDDVTLPDLVLGERDPIWASIVVLNPTTNATRQLYLQVAGAGNHPRNRFPVEVWPLGARKVAFQVTPPAASRAGDLNLELQLIRLDRGKRTVLDTAPLKLGVREPTQLHRRTFLSRMDGSVQYYAVNPPPVRRDAPALFLSLHGASVEGASQAASYSPKTWGVIVSPTNRRPYGFDWEEWGRWDALEVLDLAMQRYHADPTRIYLTGHSMGGHGTWSLGATYPDRFAAIGPSAGWISFRTYTRPGQASETHSPMTDLLRRAAASSDTLNLVSNYLHQAVYVLHGDADDNVPVREARTMREHLSRFHHDFAWHEQPGAGHWWDASDEPGTDCVDWAPMFDLFARHRIPSMAETRTVQFTTVNPGVSSRCQWLAVEAQEHALEPSHIIARCDPGRRRISAQTVNIARLRFEIGALMPAGAPIHIELDGQKLENLPWPATLSRPPGGHDPKAQVALERANDPWKLAAKADPAHKNPLRYGPFREAFNRRMLLVYATHGTPAENAWALAKARFDAESFGYRGNGSIDVLADTAFLARQGPDLRAPDGGQRNVILYGHADANSAWPVLLSESPVRVRRGMVRIGSREIAGDDLGVLFLRPSPRDALALVGVVAGSGLPGLRLTERLPVFLAGPGLPDCLVVGTDMLTRGVDGVRAAGFFGRDWSVDRGDFVWASTAP